MKCMLNKDMNITDHILFGFEKKQHTKFRPQATLQRCNLNKHCPGNITTNNANRTNIGQTKELNMHVFENKTT